DLHTTDIIQPNFFISFNAVQRIDVNLIFHLLNNAPGLFGGVLYCIFTIWIQGLFIQPANHHINILAYLGLVIRFSNHITTTNINIILQGHGNRHRLVNLFLFILIGFHRINFTLKAGRQRNNLISRFKYASGYFTSISTIIMILVVLWSGHPLYRKATIHMVIVSPYLYIF